MPNQWLTGVAAMTGTALVGSGVLSSPEAGRIEISAALAVAGLLIFALFLPRRRFASQRSKYFRLGQSRQDRRNHQ